MPQVRTITKGEPLRELADQLRTPLFELDGALGELSDVEQTQLTPKAKMLAESQA